jgi:hypothetical protein
VLARLPAPASLLSDTMLTSVAVKMIMENVESDIGSGVSSCRRDAPFGCYVAAVSVAPADQFTARVATLDIPAASLWKFVTMSPPDAEPPFRGAISSDGVRWRGSKDSSSKPDEDVDTPRTKTKSRTWRILDFFYTRVPPEIKQEPPLPESRAEFLEHWFRTLLQWPNFASWYAALPAESQSFVVARIKNQLALLVAVRYDANERLGCSTSLTVCVRLSTYARWKIGDSYGHEAKNAKLVNPAIERAMCREGMDPDVLLWERVGV